MKSNTRTSDIESKPAATRSVSGVSSTVGAKTSRRTKPSNSASICCASAIRLGNGCLSPNLPGDGCARQRTHDAQTRRHFETGQVRAAELAHRVQVGFRVFQNDLCLDHFTEVRMQPAIDARFANVRMTVQNRFDFLGKHFSPGKVDHGGLAPGQKEKAFRVKPPDITGNKPAVFEQPFARQPGRGISIQKSRAAHGDLTTTRLVGIKNLYLEIR